MKKATALLCIILTILSLAGCSGGKPGADSKKEVLTYEETQDISKSIKDVLPTNYDYSVYVFENSENTIDVSVSLNIEKDKEIPLFAETTEISVEKVKEIFETRLHILNKLQVTFLIYEHLSDKKANGTISYETNNLETGRLTYLTTGKDSIIKNDLTVLDVNELLCGKNSTASAELLEAVKPYQGEWQWKGHDTKYIINGIEVNSIHYDIKNEKAISDIFTFYFGFDEKGNLVVENEHGQARFTLTINNNGELEEQNIPKDGKIDEYKRVSDNTTVPLISEKPHIGMTQEEMQNSLWGYPDKINKTTTASGITEQWVYRGTNGYKGYVYFTNGILTSIQE